MQDEFESVDIDDDDIIFDDEDEEDSIVYFDQEDIPSKRGRKPKK